MRKLLAIAFAFVTAIVASAALGMLPLSSDAVEVAPGHEFLARKHAEGGISENLLAQRDRERPSDRRDNTFRDPGPISPSHRRAIDELQERLNLRVPENDLREPEKKAPIKDLRKPEKAPKKLSPGPGPSRGGAGGEYLRRGDDSSHSHHEHSPTRCDKPDTPDCPP